MKATINNERTNNMTITERIKQEARMISRPLYIFLGNDEYDQLFTEKPEELCLTPDGKIVFDLVEIIEVNKKSFFLVTG